MKVDELKKRLLEITEEKHRRSGGNNGTYLVEFRNKTGAEISDIKTALNELRRERKIRTADGSQGRLVLMPKKYKFAERNEK